jgi:serine/threonine protein kinase
MAGALRARFPSDMGFPSPDTNEKPVQHADTLRGRPPEAELLLGRYRLVRRLGAGGFGTVWLAHDERLDRDVAVKRIPLDDGDPERAEREAQAAARLSHPAIVTLYETGSDDEACYLVSELVRGSTLGDLLTEGALSDRDVVIIGATLCEALAHAHARGVIHRDVKPGNVMVCEQHGDGAPTAKVCDFGIARIVGGEALTLTGDVVGTLAYMAPEQA